tara:strand:- start:820 stop:1473 length:654 start_codon:yes stop_codon:yes gene_type:complete
MRRRSCLFCQHENVDELEKQIEDMEFSCDTLDEDMSWRSGTSAQHQRNHMGDYVNSSNPKCAICIDPMRAEYERQLHEGLITTDEVSEGLNITKTQVHRHVKHHLQPIVQQSAANIIAKKELNEVDMLAGNIGLLDTKITEIASRDDLDARELDALVKLAREIRESLKYMMEFKGKLVHKRQDTIIVAQMQVVQEVLAQGHPKVWLDVKKKMQERLQ